MVTGVRIRKGQRTRSMWCQSSFTFRIFLCIGMVPMIFPESEALRTNLSIFGSMNTLQYYEYYTTTTSSISSSSCMIQKQQHPQPIIRDSYVCPSLIRPRSVGSLIEAAHSLGRIRTQFQHDRIRRYRCQRDPLFALISWIVVAVVSSSFVLWSRFYRWKFTILLLGLLAVQWSSSTEGIYATTHTTLRLLGSWYLTNLNTNPIITKSISAGMIGTIADYVAQWLEHILQRRRNSPHSLSTGDIAELLCHHHHHRTTSILPSSPRSYYTTITIHGRYDVRRGISTLMDGLFISGPLMHVGYDLFESILPINNTDNGGWFAAMLHVMADSIFLDSFFVASKFFTTGLMEGITVHDLLQQFYTTYIPSLRASWITSMLMCPIQLSCFCYLPLSFRVLSVNIIDVVWDAVLSFMTHRSR